MTQDRDEAAAVDIERFQEILDAYGADSSAWPDDERQAAEAFAEEDAAGRAALAEAVALDELLGAAPSIQPSAALRRRVLEAAPEPRRSWLEVLDRWTVSLWPFTPRWQPAAALAAAAALGVVIGASSPDGTLTTEPIEIAEVAFDDIDAEDSADEWGELP
ncbi:MAG: hypothetical protein JRI23_13315 [Deltaproteobacteria bacterium]|jgi:hypothetical protein|nr:hypothetical protein [Deltaproteobacteria bacterium]MBW2532703.1 hypothetical protein [Deltaproteobacteria bacterium]